MHFRFIPVLLFLCCAVSYAAPAPSAARAKKPARAEEVKTTACSRSAVADSGGAYFRKISSLPDKKAMGLQGRGILPRVAFDSGRFYRPAQDEPSWKLGPLDRPSVYMGASSKTGELDCGLAWDRLYDSAGREGFTTARDPNSDGPEPVRHYYVEPSSPSLYDAYGKLLASGKAAVDAKAIELSLKPAFAFRPFWRTSGPDGAWHNPEVTARDNFYYFPGENFQMSVVYSGSDTFRLSVSAPGRDFSVSFSQPGLAGKARSFKRVNSIDQFRVVDGRRAGNENMDVMPTASRAFVGVWKSVSLMLDGAPPKPLSGSVCSEQRGRDTASRYSSIFTAGGWTADGGETIDIMP